MRYDGPPGMMLDLAPASPDGVDLEWAHPYCTSPNSNTVAYELLAACMTRRPPTPSDFAPPACNTQPPAPGFGPFK
jgi:hypothetical protein